MRLLTQEAEKQVGVTGKFSEEWQMPEMKMQTETCPHADEYSRMGKRLCAMAGKGVLKGGKSGRKLLE